MLSAVVDALFACGTLEAPAVLRAVAGRAAPGEPARLRGYAALCVRGADYPGLLAREGAVTEGTLYRGLASREFARIDAYEGALYVCRSLDVETHAGARCEARVYLLREGEEHQLDLQPWDRAAFLARAGR